MRDGWIVRGPQRYYFAVHPERIRGFVDLLTHPRVTALSAQVLGPDYQVVRELGLATTTQRFHIGFMGCYAAFPALRAAKAFCEADPDAVVVLRQTATCPQHHCPAVAIDAPPSPGPLALPLPASDRRAS